MRRLLPLLTLLLVGCKHAEVSTLKVLTPPDLGNSGWTTAFDKESGVSIALPPGWRVGVPRAVDPMAALGNAGSSDTPNPALQEMMDGMAKQSSHDERTQLADMREKEGIVLHCVDGSKPTIGEEPTRIYVKRIPDANYGSLEEAATAEKQETHRDAKTETVALPVGKAVRLLAQGRNRIGDEECHVSYVFLDGKDAYVLRFASTNSPGAILDVERQVAQTFRVAKK